MKRTAELTFGATNVLSAALVAFGVFHALPARWWPVDSVAVVVCTLLAGSGAGLLTRQPWASRLARVASKVVLAVGLVMIALMALSASFLWGIYGPVGRGGATILILVVALAVPYLVVLPAIQLFCLGPRSK